MRLPLLALALVLVHAALPATAREVIRYRTPDGSIGFVDDEKRLPAGVEVLSRTPLDPPAPRPAPPAAAAEPADGQPALAAGAAVTPEAGAAAADAEPDADCGTITGPLEKLRCRSRHEQRCSHFGLSPNCPRDRIAAAEGWCARGGALRDEIASLDDERDAARESLEQCRQRGGMRPDCETDELDLAEAAVRTGERRIEALEEQCHDEGCLPGWVREGCDRR
jgi:hypothetical protein